MAEAEQLRQQLIWGGYRLANELRKVVHTQHGQTLTLPSKQSGSPHGEQRKKTRQSAVVIDIQDVLQSIKGKLRENR